MFVTCGLLPALLGLGAFAGWFYNRPKEKERKRLEKEAIANEHKRWEEAKARWQKLYY